VVTPHLPWKFHANWSSCFLIILLTKKQRKKEKKETNNEIDRKQFPVPDTIGGGVIIITAKKIYGSETLWEFKITECLSTWASIKNPRSGRIISIRIICVHALRLILRIWVILTWIYVKMVSFNLWPDHQRHLKTPALKYYRGWASIKINVLWLWDIFMSERLVFWLALGMLTLIAILSFLSQFLTIFHLFSAQLPTQWLDFGHFNRFYIYILHYTENELKTNCNHFAILDL